MHPLSLVSVKFSSAALALKLVLVLATLFFTSSAWLSAIVAVLSGALLCAACAYWPPYFRLTGPPLPSGGNNARIEDTGAKPWTQEAAPGDDMAVPELALIGGDVVAVDDPAAAPAALPLAAKTTDSGSACGRCCRGAMSAALHYGSTNLTRLALCLGVFWMYVRGWCATTQGAGADLHSVRRQVCVRDAVRSRRAGKRGRGSAAHRVPRGGGWHRLVPCMGRVEASPPICDVEGSR